MRKDFEKITDKELIKTFKEIDKKVHNDFKEEVKMDRFWYDMFVEELHNRDFRIIRTTEVKK